MRTTDEGATIRRQTYWVGVLAGVICALLIATTATASVTAQTYTNAVSGPKQERKAFGPVNSLFQQVNTAYSPGLFAPSSMQTVIVYSKDLRFTPGNIPQCSLTAIEHASAAAARAACPGSVIGQGSAQLNNNAPAYAPVVVTVFNGPSSPSPTIYEHLDIKNNLATSVVTGTFNQSTNTLTLTGTPTPGVALTEFDTTLNKVRSGKKTYNLMARCGKKKRYVNTETTTYTDGSTTTATSVQRCKQKRSKKK